jgi:hypothetical protein
MNRRAFLGAAASAALAMMVRRAFGDSSLPGKKGGNSSAVAPVDLKAAMARAAAAGVPLFMIVIPEDDAQKWDRGQAWGELLNHGDAAALAPLGRAEVVCAPVSQLAQVAVPGISGAEPVAVVIDPKTAKIERLLHTTLAPYEERFIRVAKEKEKIRPDEEVFTERVAAMAQLVQSGLGPVPAGSEAQLAQQCKHKLVDRPPPGSHWANASGCGPSRVEQTPEEKAEEERQQKEDLKKGIFRSKSIVGYGCGMGHVPQKSGRFLYFLAKAPND